MNAVRVCLHALSRTHEIFNLEIGHAQTVFVGAQERGHGAPHRLDPIREFLRGLCKFSGCGRIPDRLFLSDNLLEWIYRLLRSHNDPRVFHLEHDSMLM